MLAVANTGSCVGPQNKKKSPCSSHTFDVGSRVECPRNINRFENTSYRVSEFAFLNNEYNFDFPREIGVFYEI